MQDNFGNTFLNHACFRQLVQRYVLHLKNTKSTHNDLCHVDFDGRKKIVITW